LEIFKCEKQKYCKGHFVVRFWKAHGKVTKTTSRNSAFAMRFIVAHDKGAIDCHAFLWRRRGDCRALSMVAHGKGR
jgi:hypothetical protein